MSIYLFEFPARAVVVFVTEFADTLLSDQIQRYKFEIKFRLRPHTFQLVSVIDSRLQKGRQLLKLFLFLVKLSTFDTHCGLHQTLKLIHPWFCPWYWIFHLRWR